MKNLKEIQVTLQEIWAATRPNVFKNKKKYTRRKKHPRRRLGYPGYLSYIYGVNKKNKGYAHSRIHKFKQVRKHENP